MKRGVFVVAVAVALVGVLGGGVALAQSVTVVNVPFKFTVGAKVMDAGRYELQLNAEHTVVSAVPAKGAAVFMPAITRLAVLDPSDTGRIVFDKVDNQYYLSEVWLPGEDGFLVRDTRQPHQHHIVNAEKKKTL